MKSTIKPFPVDFSEVINQLTQIDQIQHLTPDEKQKAQMRLLMERDKKLNAEEFSDYTMVNQHLLKEVTLKIDKAKDCGRPYLTLKIFNFLLSVMDKKGCCKVGVNEIMEEFGVAKTQVAECLRWLGNNNVIDAPKDSRGRYKFSIIYTAGLFINDQIARKRANWQHLERKEAERAGKTFEHQENLFGERSGGIQETAYGIEKRHKKSLRKAHKEHFAEPYEPKNPHIAAMAKSLAKHTSTKEKRPYN